LTEPSLPRDRAGADARALERHFAQSAFVADVGVLEAGDDGRWRLLVLPDIAELRRNGLTGVGELIRFEFETLAVQHVPPLPLPEVVFTFDPLPRAPNGAIDTVAALDLHTSHVVFRERRPLPDTAAARLVRDALHSRGRGTGAALLDADTNLELDLDLDSLARAELLAEIESRLGHRPTTSGLTGEDVFTVGDLVMRVERLVPDAARTAVGHESQDRWEEILQATPGDETPAPHLDAWRTLRAVGFWVTIRLLRLIAWPVLRVRIIGREHLPTRGPALICPNHESFLDAFVMTAALPLGLLRDVFYLGATEYFATKTMATIARVINLVPVDADRNLARALQVGAAGLRRGKVLVIFPEGERSIDGTIRTFRGGTSLLSRATSTPIVPVAIRGFFDVWPRGFGPRWEAFRPWHPVRVTVAIGPAIDGRSAASVDGTTRVLRDTVQSLWERAGLNPPQSL